MYWDFYSAFASNHFLCLKHLLCFVAVGINKKSRCMTCLIWPVCSKNGIFLTSDEGWSLFHSTQQKDGRGNRSLPFLLKATTMQSISYDKKSEIVVEKRLAYGKKCYMSALTKLFFGFALLLFPEKSNLRVFIDVYVN